MLDHVGLRVSDMAASRAFYERALAPLGYSVQMDFGTVALGFGRDPKPDFWLYPSAQPGQLHLAFGAPDRATVDAFHAAALAAGATCNGPPGLRPQYHPNYYGAFVLDPDGVNLEAVCHLPA